jgi:hypothetical protein
MVLVRSMERAGGKRRLVGRFDALERTELRLKRYLDFGLMALLLAGAAVQTGCGNTAEPPMNARKYWDRCLGAQCPPMDETDARKK